MIASEIKAAAIEALAINTVGYAQRSNPSLPSWSELPAIFRHAQLEWASEMMSTIWPILEDNEAAILRARLEMLVTDLEGRGEPLLAAELKAILTDPIGA